MLTPTSSCYKYLTKTEKNIFTMTLRGAANTAILMMAQTHPTKATLFEPFTASRETSMITPKPPPLNSRIHLIVKILNKNHIINHKSLYSV